MNDLSFRILSELDSHPRSPVFFYKSSDYSGLDINELSSSFRKLSRRGFIFLGDSNFEMKITQKGSEALDAARFERVKSKAEKLRDKKETVRFIITTSIGLLTLLFTLLK